MEASDHSDNPFSDGSDEAARQAERPPAAETGAEKAADYQQEVSERAFQELHDEYFGAVLDLDQVPLEFRDEIVARSDALLQEMADATARYFPEGDWDQDSLKDLLIDTLDRSGIAERLEDIYREVPADVAPEYQERLEGLADEINRPELGPEAVLPLALGMSGSLIEAFAPPYHDIDDPLLEFRSDENIGQRAAELREYLDFISRPPLAEGPVGDR